MASHGSGGSSPKFGKSDLIDVFVRGDATKVAEFEKAHPGGTTIAGEMLENIVADAVSKHTGFGIVTNILERTGEWGKYGLELGGLAASPVFVATLFQLLEKNGVDQKVLMTLRPFVTNVMEGVSRGAINASDPDRKQKILAVAQQTATQLTGAFRDPYGMVHLKQMDHAGNLLPADANGYPVACGPWQAFVNGWVVLHPAPAARPAVRAGGAAPAAPATRMSVVEGDAYDLLGSGTPCPHCFKNKAVPSSVPAAKGSTFWQKVKGNEAAKEVLAAVTHHAAHDHRAYVTVDLLEDLERGCDFDALTLVCDQIRPRLVAWNDASGTFHHFEITAEDAREFRVWIDAFGGAELKAHNKVSEAVHNVLEEAKHTYAHRKEHDGWQIALIAAAGVVLLPILYVALLAVDGLLFLVGVFAPETHPYLNIGLIAATAVGGILLLAPWYSVGGITSFLGGFIHAHQEPGEHEPSAFANMARNITALQNVVGILAVGILTLGVLFGFDTLFIRWVIIPVVTMALVGYNRIAAAWHGSEEIHHQMEHLAQRNITLLSLVVTLVALSVVPFGYRQYVEANTVFRLAVECSTDGADSACYIPTPTGKMFRAEDILGRTKAEEVKTDDSAKDGLCLPVGFEIDLPGYHERVVPEVCEDGKVGYAISSHPFGMNFQFGDDGPREYESLEELRAASRAEEKAIVATPVATTDGAPVSPAASTTVSGSVAPARAASARTPAKARQAERPPVADDDIPDMFKK